MSDCRQLFTVRLRCWLCRSAFPSMHISKMRWRKRLSLLLPLVDANTLANGRNAVGAEGPVRPVPFAPLTSASHFEVLAGDLRVRITLLSAQKEPSLLCLCKRSDRKTRNNPRFSC